MVEGKLGPEETAMTEGKLWEMLSPHDHATQLNSFPFRFTLWCSALFYPIPTALSDSVVASPYTFMDFGFRDSSRRTCNSWSFGSEVEFQPQTSAEDGVGICSPPLWNKTASIQNAISSPLLPHDHCFSHSAPTSQLEKIVDARRELMEMVANMSESTYELSLKDIVDDEYTSKEVLEEGGSVEDTSMSFNSEIELLQRKSKTKRKAIRSCQVSRSTSMEKEVFLLKMCFPTSMGMKRKSAVRQGSKVPQKSLSDDNAHKKGWKRIFLFAAQSKSNGTNSNRSSSGSSSRSNSSKSRQANETVSSGCWSFIQPKKTRAEDRGD